MRPCRFLPLALLMLLTAARLVSAGTYYVAPAGSDSTGDGTAAAPWQTIRHATDTIPDDGSMALIKDGLYVGTQSLARAFTQPGKNGSQRSPTTQRQSNSRLHSPRQLKAEDGQLKTAPSPLRPLLLSLALLYSFCLIVTWAALHRGDDGCWWTTILLFAPRWPFGLSLTVPIPAAAALKPRLLPLMLLDLVFLAGPLMSLLPPRGRTRRRWAGRPPS